MLSMPCAGVHARGQALEPLISGTGIWETTRGDFVKQHQDMGFHWLDTAQDQAETQDRGVTLFSGTVYQVDAAFNGEKLSGVTVSIYNRGDAGNLTSDTWAGMLRHTFDRLTALTKTQPEDQGREASDAVKAFAVAWRTPVSTYLLEYSFTREVKTRGIPFRAEFLRLRIMPAEKPKSFMAAALAATSPADAAGRFDAQSHVKKEAEGDVRIETVPMVDQGKKGYCVVASAERVLRYYGVPVDENELAELSNSSASQGTSFTAMLDSLKKLSNRLRIRVRNISEMDARQLLAMTNEYNRIARRKREQALPDLGTIVDMQQLYAAMQPELLKEARTHNKGDVTRFQKEVQDSIDQGIPVLWGVMLGVVPETMAPRGIGGHMRLIIGYNTESNEILYTDSWGPGHELKRMAADDAWTMTLALDTIEPE